jgi:hypothetical protein
MNLFYILRRSIFVWWHGIRHGKLADATELRDGKAIVRYQCSCGAFAETVI